MERKQRLDPGSYLGAAVTIILFVAIVSVGVVLSDHGFSLGVSGSGTQTATAVLDAAIGATVEPLDRATAQRLSIPLGAKGLVITSLAANGPAEQAGIKVGDVIERIDGEPVGTSSDAKAALKNERSAIVLTLNRGGHYTNVRLPIRALSDQRDLVEEGAAR